MWLTETKYYQKQTPSKGQNTAYTVKEIFSTINIEKETFQSKKQIIKKINKEEIVKMSKYVCRMTIATILIKQARSSQVFKTIERDPNHQPNKPQTNSIMQ